MESLQETWKSSLPPSAWSKNVAETWASSSKVSKCELVLTAHAPSYSLADLFPQSLLVDEETGASRVLPNGNFELLGAAIGDDSFCDAYMSERVHKASKLPNELKQLEDSQVALRLLRSCAGVCVQGQPQHADDPSTPTLHSPL